MTFNNRSAVITGAAGCIGRALAKEFVKHNVKLFLTDIDLEKLEAFAAELRSEGGHVTAYYLDVTDLDSITQAAEKILADAGRIDILVNNAGSWPKGTSLETTDEAWLNIINLNLTSVFRISKAFGAKMKENGYGRIINLGSIAGIVGLPERCAYSVAKAGVTMLTKTMAMELAKCGVTVNCIAPGVIKDTPIPTAGTWLGRYGTGTEVANAIVFLASDETAFITGTEFPVDGGRTLGPLNPSFKG